MSKEGLVLTGNMRVVAPLPVVVPMSVSCVDDHVVSVSDVQPPLPLQVRLPTDSDEDDAAVVLAAGVVGAVAAEAPAMVEAANELIAAISDGNLVGGVVPFCNAVGAVSDACENVIAPACGYGDQLPAFADAVLKLVVAGSILAIAIVITRAWW